jgi:hypothetical protein
MSLLYKYRTSQMDTMFYFSSDICAKTFHHMLLLWVSINKKSTLFDDIKNILWKNISRKRTVSIQVSIT